MTLRSKTGFTLIEIMIIITIVGVLVGVAAVNLGRDVKRARLKEAIAQFHSDLKKCRVDAMSSMNDPKSRGYGFKFTSATTYELFEFKDNNDDYTYIDGEEVNTPPNTPREVTLPNGVQARIDSGTLTTPLIFDRRGWLRSASWASANGATYIFELADAKALCVVLSTSRIRQGSWNGTSCVSN